MALPPTSTKGSGDSTPVTTFQIDAPNIPITHSGVVATIGTIPIAGGGTGQTTQTSAFDALAPNTTKGDLIAYNGSDNIRVAVGTNSQVLKADSGTASGLIWATNPASNFSVNPQTTTYSITTADDIILCSGSAFTVTLPTAVGNSGKTFTIEKTDVGSTNLITIATTSSQTIGAGGPTSLGLAVQGESVTLYSDGANWQISQSNISYSARYTIPAGKTADASNPIDASTLIFDPHSCVTTGATWKFTAKEAGTYSVGVAVYYAANGDTFVYLNGSQEVFLCFPTVIASGAGSAIVKMAAGDYVDVRPTSSITTNAAPGRAHISIFRTGL